MTDTKEETAPKVEEKEEAKRASPQVPDAAKDAAEAPKAEDEAKRATPPVEKKEASEKKASPKKPA